MQVSILYINVIKQIAEHGLIFLLSLMYRKIFIGRILSIKPENIKYVANNRQICMYDLIRPLRANHHSMVPVPTKQVCFVCYQVIKSVTHSQWCRFFWLYRQFFYLLEFADIGALCMDEDSKGRSSRFIYHYHNMCWTGRGTKRSMMILVERSWSFNV
jgi:hypothetical protein